MTTSKQWHQRAMAVMPGGVNSPVRSFDAVGGEPIIMASGYGACVRDIEGNDYIDYVGQYGPAILGHAHPDVVEAVSAAARAGFGFGATTSAEIELAERVCAIVPSVEKVRLCNSGTEATMTALRLARGVTGRDAVIKFEGCYHGHADPFLVKAGSGALTTGTPNSAGVPEAVGNLTYCLPYNDGEAVSALFARHGEQIAAVIVEPVAGNMNLVLPQPDFLPTLRCLCDEYGALLICDEVMTGFRVGLAGACARFGIRADLITLGKIIGGGLPIGAVGGNAQWMDHLSPAGSVYQAGTLSGNPLAVAAGLATLDHISRSEFYATLEQKTQKLVHGMTQTAAAHGINLKTSAIGGMFGFLFTDCSAITSYDQVKQCDVATFGRFFSAMLDQGVMFAPSAFEAAFMSSVHDDAQIDATLRACEMVFSALPD